MALLAGVCLLTSSTRLLVTVLRALKQTSRPGGYCAPHLLCGFDFLIVGHLQLWLGFWHLHRTREVRGMHELRKQQAMQHRHC